MRLVNMLTQFGCHSLCLYQDSKEPFIVFAPSIGVKFNQGVQQPFDQYGMFLCSYLCSINVHGSAFRLNEDGLKTNMGIEINQERMLDPLQLRAARAMLNWSVADVTSAVGISSATLNRAEKPGARGVTDLVINGLRMTYEKHGIEFTFDDGLGVKLRPKTES
jgi:hypothetical protein